MNWTQLISEISGKTNLTVIILSVALLMARTIPIIATSPIFGGELIEAEVKIGISLLLSLVLLPGLLDQSKGIIPSAFPFIGLLLKEVFIGLSLSFVVSIVFEAARVAGGIVDTLSGFNMAQVMVPQLQQQVTIFSNLKLQISITLFLTLDGHHRVIEALADSFVAIPLDKYPAFSHGAWPFFELILRVFGDLLKIGLAIGAPAYLATFITDMSFGFVNRVAPQVQVYFMSMGLKPMVAIAMVMISLNLVGVRLVHEFRGMFRVLSEAVRLLS